MSAVSQNLKRYLDSLPQGVDLVAVSKFQPVEAILEAYNAGQRVFGESRAQELSKKALELPSDISWHFIGHLQTNKAKQVVGAADIIESVDSVRLLTLIDSIAAEKGICQDVLLQVHVAKEETKFGFAPDELLDFFRMQTYKNLRATRLRGLMGMASNTDDTARIRSDFREISSLRARILEMCPDLPDFNILSMGMSDDYTIAIEEGATHIRLGTAIFGERH